MGTRALLVVAGFAIGVLAGIAWSRLGHEPAAPAPEGPAAESEALLAGIQDREARIRDLEAKLARAEADLALARKAPAPPGPTKPGKGAAGPGGAEAGPPAAEQGPLTLEQLREGVREFGRGFQAYLLGDGKAQRARLRALFARASDADVAALLDEFSKTDDLGKKTILAHALANSGRPEAIRLLREIVTDREKGLFDRRVAAHGLAFSDAEGLDPLLEEVARNDPERGVRANAAFGLARRGNDAGIELYAAATDEAFAEKDPLAAQYLSGFYLLGERALPAVRERILEYKDPQARRVLIELVKQRKDREAVPVLRELAGDPEADASIRRSAERAIRVIEGE